MDKPKMTLLDYFAGQALVGLTASSEFAGDQYETLAREAYAIAVCMMEIKEEADENLN